MNVAEEINWKPLSAGAFMAAIGPLLTTRDGEDGFIYALETREEHANALGLVHGGVITGLLDQAISLVAWTAADRAPVVTVQIDTRFLVATKPGVILKARAQIRHIAGSMMFVDAEVADGTQRIALATAIMKTARMAA
jgi:uncharacterized protein (TIGR00369 family)